jgi:hypothetical protein
MEAATMAVEAVEAWAWAGCGRRTGEQRAEDRTVVEGGVPLRLSLSSSD